MPDHPPAAEQRAGSPDTGPAVQAIVRRGRNLTPAERRGLGRWTSASLRDPRIAPHLEAARAKALEVLDQEPGRRKRWESSSKPLYEELVEGTRDARRWRFVMLASHLIALVAIVNVPGGLPAVVALGITVTAPISAWAAWGSGIGSLGAIHAALAAAVADRVEPDDVEWLQQAWRNAIETDPPLSPPLLGAINALAPSALLVVSLFLVVATSVPG